MVRSYISYFCLSGSHFKVFFKCNARLEGEAEGGKVGARAEKKRLKSINENKSGTGRWSCD